MITIIFVLLFSTFKTINTISAPYEKCSNQNVNVSNCQCSSTNFDDIDIIYNTSIGLKLTMKVKIWDDLKIDCEFGEPLNNFKFMSKKPGRTINSLTFENCGLRNNISLIDTAKRFGVEGTRTLIFQSNRNLSTILERKHFEGIQAVTKLALLDNGITNISSEIFLNFPDLKWLDLSDNNIILSDNIFDATPNLEQLVLTGNYINSIKTGLFKNLKYLEYLNLKRNQLTELDATVFDEIPTLKTLNLAVNSLSTLPSNIFDKLINLEKIDLSFNNFFSLPLKLFDQNKNLQRILFHDNGVFLFTLPDNLFSNLEKIEEIYLNNNGLAYLPENLFWGSSSLKYINLEYNLIRVLAKNIFKGLQNLILFTIKNNKIDTLPEGIFKDLGKLKKLDLSRNNINYIATGTFEGLTSLIELNMEYNCLKNIKQEALMPLKNLSIAKFSNNQLDFDEGSKVWSPFYNNHLITELHLSNNSIHSLYSDWSMSRYKLRLLNLTLNKISNLTAHNFVLPSDNITVDLRYNSIRNIYFNEIESLASHQTEKRDVVILVDHNPLLCDCYLYDFLRYYHKEMSNNVYHFVNINPGELTCVQTDGTEGPKIKELNSTTYICPEDKYFKIEKNCQIGCTCGAMPIDKTRILDCSYQNRSEFLIDQTRINYVGKYPIILNLTGNFLTKIPSVEPLKPLIVTGLLLSNNHIAEITLDQLPPNLKVLELHNNYISHIDPTVVRNLYTRSLNAFTLSGNPIICNCYSLDLLVFIKTKRFHFEDLNNLKCNEMDAPMYSFTFLELCEDLRNTG